MPAAIAYAHIVKSAFEPARLERHPRTRVAMSVTDYLNRGWSAEEIVLQYPYLGRVGFVMDKGRLPQNESGAKFAT